MNQLWDFRRGCHLYSAGRPSRWASAHILVAFEKNSHWKFFRKRYGVWQKIRITTNCVVSGIGLIWLTVVTIFLRTLETYVCVLKLITQWFEQSERHRLFQRAILRKLWLTPAARVPCSNAANIGERRTWTQSEFYIFQNSVTYLSVADDPRHCCWWCCWWLYYHQDARALKKQIQ